MRFAYFLLLLVLNETAWSQSSLNTTLLDNWKQDSLLTNSSLARYNDCFGFVWKGREYAVAGSTEGTHVFEISDDNTFVSKGFIRGRFSNASVSHRDYATYQHYLYAVCDEGVSSLQIIDFQYLPDSIHLETEDTVQFGRVHDVFIDTIQAKLYSCIHRSTTSTSIIEAPMKIFSLANPLNLVELWSGPVDIPEVHDCYVRNGKAILNCGFDGLRVYDFTNTASPLFLDSKTVYQDQGYNHQGWLTPNGETYVFADETNGKRIKKCSFDGTTITIQNYFGTNFSNGSVPHNIMVTDTFAFVAYYNEGLRIFDLRYPIPKEIAHFDSYPDNSPFKLNGNWGIYSLLPSKRLLISDRQYGLFLIGFDQGVFSTTIQEEQIYAYPNPIVSNQDFTIRLPETITKFDWEINNEVGQILQKGSVNDFSFLSVPLDHSAGVYGVKITFINYLGEEEIRVVKVVVI